MVQWKGRRYLKTVMRPKDYAEQVAQTFIERLEAGTTPWQRPWDPGLSGSPMNPNSGKPYRGINSIYLECAGYSDPRWMTYKQAQARDAQVRKGEKGQLVEYWDWYENLKNPDGSPMKDKDGKQVRAKRQVPRVFHARVFNAEQMDNIEPYEKPQVQWDANKRADDLLKASGANIEHVPGNRAYYSPSEDRICLPDRLQFPTKEQYYATALHELGHWTGHSSRLDRDGITGGHGFGSIEYAKEELRAEIASYMVGRDIGVGHEIGNHAAYVKSWIRVLQEDPREIFRAARDAEQARSFVLQYDRFQEQKHEKVKEQTLELTR